MILDADRFPEDGRTVPWGTGCTIFFNYVDLQFRNDTAETIQVRLRVGDTPEPDGHCQREGTLVHDRGVGWAARRG